AWSGAWSDSIATGRTIRPAAWRGRDGFHRAGPRCGCLLFVHKCSCLVRISPVGFAPSATGSEGGGHAPCVTGVRRFTVWSLGCTGFRRRAGPAPERAGQVRFLCAVALLVAV